MDVPFCFSNSEMFFQKEICLLDPVEEQSDISFEMHEKDEVVDVSPGNCHEFSLHSSFEDQFDSVQGNLQLRQPSHGKQMT